MSIHVKESQLRPSKAVANAISHGKNNKVVSPNTPPSLTEIAPGRKDNIVQPNPEQIGIEQRHKDPIRPAIQRVTGTESQEYLPKMPAPSNATTVQLVGKKGHIAIGAAIGSIVPGLGTALGAYIGNRIYKKKKQARLDRGTRDQSNAGAVDQTALNALHAHILSIRVDIQASRFKEAIESIRDKTILGALGITNNVSYAFPPKGVVTNETVNTISEKNIFWVEKNSVSITLPIAPDWWESAGESISKQILFMALEEYMHVYQHLSNSFFSPSTQKYKSSETALSKGKGRLDYDFDEIDVMAAYQDWGEDVEALGYVNRYQEREDFNNWRKKH